MSLTQSSGAVLVQQTAVKGVIIATASNNLLKGFYTLGTANGPARTQGFIFLVSLSGLGLLAFLLV